MARKKRFLVNLARRLDKLPTPGIESYKKAYTNFDQKLIKNFEKLKTRPFFETLV